MNKGIRKLMEKHNLPQSAMTLYGLEIERIAEDYARSKDAIKTVCPNCEMEVEPVFVGGSMCPNCYYDM